MHSKTNKTIYEITKAGVLMALAIAFSFISFPLLGGRVFLIGTIIFLMPLVLRIDFALICGIGSVVIADALNSFILFSWMSIIAYCPAIIIVKLFCKLKFKFIFIIGIIIASIYVILTYLILEWVYWDKAQAVGDLIATIIQFLIIIPLVSVCYSALKITKIRV